MSARQAAPPRRRRSRPPPPPRRRPRTPREITPFEIAATLRLLRAAELDKGWLSAVSLTDHSGAMAFLFYAGAREHDPFGAMLAHGNIGEPDGAVVPGWQWFCQVDAACSEYPTAQTLPGAILSAAAHLERCHRKSPGKPCALADSPGELIAPEINGN